MKILKIFGAVFAVHVLAFVVIFANPGCTSSNAATASTDEGTSDAAEAAAPSILPVSMPPPNFAAAINFDPNAPAVPPGRYSPTRPSEVAPPTPVAPAPQEPIATAAPAAPAATNEQATAAPQNQEPIVYTVVGGDSLWSVSKRYGISFSELAAANGLPSSAGLRVGQRLTIPPSRAAAAASAAPASGNTPDGASAHVVQSGETLSAIAQRYGVRLAEIQEANRIVNSDLIRPGMSLIIPGFQTVGPAPVARAQAAPAPRNDAPPPAATVPTVPNLPRPSEIPVIRLEGLNAP
jgi:LysM repeat protein